MELYLKYCGFEECDSGHVYGPIERSEYLLHIILDGKGMYEQRFLLPDGSTGYYSSTFMGLYDDDGNLKTIKGTVQDITEKKEAEIRHEKIEEQLRQAQKMDAIGRLAGGVAHDFNNMLTIILGNTEMLMAEMAAKDSIHPKLKEIYKAGERSADLTRQLLAFARKQTIAPPISEFEPGYQGYAQYAETSYR
jgi:signal transduction histidine kinase